MKEEGELRLVIINGVITGQKACEVIKALLAFNDQDGSKDIYVIVDSEGGSLTDSIAIYDVIKFLECDIVTIGVGKVAGIAAILLASGTKGRRYMAQNTNFTPTFRSKSVDGTIIYDNAEELNKLMDKIINLYAKETGNTYETMKVVANIEHYLNGYEAIDTGYIDKVFQLEDTKKDRRHLKSLFRKDKDNDKYNKVIQQLESF